MKQQTRQIGITLTFIVLVFVFEFCISDNDTWIENHDKKARVVKKLKKDFRKLKKQEGALKLVGGENGDHEGADFNAFYM